MVLAAVGQTNMTMRKLWHRLFGHGVAMEMALVRGRVVVWCDDCGVWGW